MIPVHGAKPSEHAPCVNAHDANTHFSKLLELANAGKEIVLGKEGVPDARLVPPAPFAPQREAGRLVGRVDVAFFDPLAENELTAWDRTSTCCC